MTYRNVFSIMSLIGLMMIGQPISAKDVKSAKEFRIHIGPPTGEPMAPAPFAEILPKDNRFTVIEWRQIPGPPPRQRSYELSSEQIVIIAFDAQEQEITRVVITDPRLIRAETVDTSGDLTTKIIYRNTADFTVVLPDDPNIKELRIYHPHWTGTEFILELIGEIQLP